MIEETKAQPEIKVLRDQVLWMPCATKLLSVQHQSKEDVSN